MKPTTRVSIGRTAFTLEEEAYARLKEYIGSLEAHFASSASGKEILEEIEVRIAELLLERCGSNGVVDRATIEQVIGTLGSVEDIDSEKDREKTENADADGTKKKLFRDPSDRILGGVCSGIAAYFGKDTVLIRIIAIVILLACTIPSHGIGVWIPVAAYLALWLAMPAARTVEQKYRMRGDSNDLNSIRQNIENGAAEIERTAKDFSRAHPDFWKTFARAWGIFFGVIFIIVAFAGLLSLLLVTVGTSAAIPISLATLTSSVIGLGSSAIFILGLSAVIGIPFIAILYTGILLAFGLKSPRWRPGLILFILWLVAAGAVVFIGAKAAIRYDSSDRQTANATYDISSDTLHIGLKDSEMEYNYIFLDADRDSYILAYIEGDDIYLYPEISIRRTLPKGESEVKVKSSTWYFSSRSSEPDFCSFSDGVLTLEPSVIEKGRQLTEAGRKVTIEIPADMEVRVDSPRYHDFKDDVYHTNISLLKRRW